MPDTPFGCRTALMHACSGVVLLLGEAILVKLITLCKEISFQPLLRQ